MEGKLYVGVDVGGTFTDLVVMDDRGAVQTSKSPTTPGALERGVLKVLSQAAEERALTLEEMLARVGEFGYGTTQVTNALIERTGVKTGLVTTLGFKDTLYIQRLKGFTAGLAPSQVGDYSRRRYPTPIVPRTSVRAVRERVDQAGCILVPLDEKATRAALVELRDQGCQALAIALLWSFRNPTHERRIAELAREVFDADVFISLSSEVAPVVGEYERTATTVLNSYLGPTVAAHLSHFESQLREHGFAGVFRVLNSIGGVMGASEAVQKPVQLLTSGPTGGVTGARYVADGLGYGNVITTDMGGTSFDVGLIIDGDPLVAPMTEIGGYHIATPMIDITAIGAGGGSVVTVVDGLIRVGPESARADPGPVCYGRGGTRVTVTDADVVLGIIDGASFLGGRMQLDYEGAVRAIDEQVARPLGLSVEAAAAGIKDIVDSQMADVLRELTVGRGRDPRDFVLFAYGGAGPSHCTSFAAELGVGRVVIPATSMVQSAYGALASDVHHSAEQSRLMRGGGGLAPLWTGLELEAIAREFVSLEREATGRLARDGVAEGDMELVRGIDMRYRGQSHSLIVPFATASVAAPATSQALVERFEAVYEQTYGVGSGAREAGVELTTFRVDAIGHTHKPRLERSHGGSGSGRAERRERSIYDGMTQRRLPARICDWREMVADEVIVGPAVIEHPTTTVYVDARHEAVMDQVGNLVITTRGES